VYKYRLRVPGESKGRPGSGSTRRLSSPLAEAVGAAVRASRDCRAQMTHSGLFITYRDPETGKSGHSGRGPKESL
jgi:hypothetical protein